jgi:hypothetical protein
MDRGVKKTIITACCWVLPIQGYFCMEMVDLKKFLWTLFIFGYVRSIVQGKLMGVKNKLKR